jgi:hypothetical protein
MNSSSKLEKGFLFLMAFQADIRTVFCIPLFIREDESFPFCLCMLCPRAMARFAFFSSMETLLEEIVNFRMAIFAGFSP